MNPVQVDDFSRASCSPNQSPITVSPGRLLLRDEPQEKVILLSDLVCGLLLLFGSVFGRRGGGFLSSEPSDPFRVSVFPSLGLVRS
jgi:hypothetical protein